MRLATALRLEGSAQRRSPPALRLALVGAGGKTSAMFQLARELASLPTPVLVTATTHLAVEQLALADRHLEIYTAQDLAPLESELPPGITLLTGPLGIPAGEQQRAQGLPVEALVRLRALAEAHQAPLLLEADGARRLPLKAPGPHEPALPDWVDRVVIVAGLSALGRALEGAWVHRPERFADLAGLPLGSPITPAALARVLAHPDGGLKNIPALARAAVLLNQADTPALQAQAQTLAGSLLALSRRIESVLVATLAPPAGEGLEAETVAAVHERSAGIILSAGASTRLGRPKQLLPWRGLPLVRQVALTALAAGLDPVIAVTGANREGIEAALDGLPVQAQFNPDWESGQSTSVRTGMQALPPETGSALFLLADQPQVPPTLIRSLVALHAQTLSPLAAPQAGGRRANPVLFDRQTFSDLRELEGDTGGRSLFARYPVAWLPWHDESLLLDVDTEEDYERLKTLE